MVIAVAGAGLSPSTTAAGAMPKSGCVNWIDAIRLIPPFAIAQYQRATGRSVGLRPSRIRGYRPTQPSIPVQPRQGEGSGRSVLAAALGAHGPACSRFRSSGFCSRAVRLTLFRLIRLKCGFLNFKPYMTKHVHTSKRYKAFTQKKLTRCIAFYFCVLC